MTTAHDRYTAQVHDGQWHAYNDLEADNLRRQIAALAAERDALAAALAASHAQKDALIEERAALRAENERLAAEIDELRTENTDPFDLACLDDGAATDTEETP
jgi:hypothetical protein